MKIVKSHFQFFHADGPFMEEKNDNLLFFTFLFFCEKNVFGKTIVIFCIFSNFHFSFFLGVEKLLYKKMFSSLIKKCHDLSLRVEP